MTIRDPFCEWSHSEMPCACTKPEFASQPPYFLVFFPHVPRDYQYLIAMLYHFQDILP